MLQHLRTFLLMFCVIGCHDSSFQLAWEREESSTASKDGDLTVDVDDRKRPTEEGEGLPGYLVDPSLIQTTNSDSETTEVNGLPGAVTVRGGYEKPLEGFDAEAWLANEQQLVDGRTQVVDGSRVAARSLKRFKVLSDGSFVLQLAADDASSATEVLALTFGGEHGADEISLQNAGVAQAGVYLPRGVTEFSLLVPPQDGEVESAPTLTLDDGDGTPSYTWFLAHVGHSCAKTCEDAGLAPDAATIDAVGHAGTFEECEKVAKGFGANKVARAQFGARGFGCFLTEFILPLPDGSTVKGYWQGNSTTTQEASTKPLSGDRRVCACTN